MLDFDFDKALTMHRAWKMKFHIALGRVQGEDFDSRPLGDATRCQLGHWLDANAAALRAFPAAVELLPVHEDFHRQSRAIADAIREGRILMARDVQQMNSYLRRGRVDWVTETPGTGCPTKPRREPNW